MIRRNIPAVLLAAAVIALVANTRQSLPASIDAAYAAFQEDSRGTLRPGKYADLVVLSEDILGIPEEEIPSAEVLYTIVGGRMRYRRKPQRIGEF